VRWRRVSWLHGEEEERKGERVRLTGGTQVSATARKKKKEVARWAAAGWFDGPAGLAGLKGGKVSFLFFQTPFKQLFFSNSNQILSNFFSEIYKLFRNHTSNQKPCKAN
jgi:hypothetical protein